MRIEADIEMIAAEYRMDRLQWDVELDPSILEPNIPPGYMQLLMP